MPLIVFIAPVLLILALGGIFFVQKQINNKKWTLGKFTLIYWSILAVVEIIMLIQIVIDGSVQFLPPSLFINYIYGTAFFVYFVILCAISKTKLTEKIIVILYVALLNYLILPLGFIWM